jgi:hypothetical protein
MYWYWRCGDLSGGQFGTSIVYLIILSAEGGKGRWEPGRPSRTLLANERTSAMRRQWPEQGDRKGRPYISCIKCSLTEHYEGPINRLWAR